MNTQVLEKPKAKIDYHSRPEWSYSQMKLILDSGIDYAVAAKKGLLEQPKGKAIDLGQLVHMILLGGEDTFAISEFPDFRTKVARIWRDEQIELGKNIITQAMFKEASQIVANIEAHPHYPKYLGNPKAKYEQELFATVNGVKLRGKADALISDTEWAQVIDLKTTAQFDKFAKKAFSMHYDLQASNYGLITSSSLGLDKNLVQTVYCLAETVAPYRVQYWTAGFEFIESGDNKLHKCLEEIKEFGDKEPTFLLTEIKELGDWS